jgi:hypothetical protein
VLVVVGRPLRVALPRFECLRFRVGNLRPPRLAIVDRNTKIMVVPANCQGCSVMRCHYPTRIGSTWSGCASMSASVLRPGGLVQDRRGDDQSGPSQDRGGDTGLPVTEISHVARADRPSLPSRERSTSASQRNRAHNIDATALIDRQNALPNRSHPMIH